MHSSISNSEVLEVAAPPRAPHYAKAAAVTIVLLAILLVILEAGTRVGFRRISHIESRTAIDHRDAVSLRHGSKPNILLLGNSLLLEGLDYPEIQKDPDVHFTRFVIEGTEYYDWYYGIRKLLADGSRPDLLVLCMSPLHLISSHVPNDYMGYYMFQLSDIFRMSRVTHSGMTKASSLAFAHFSLFYAGRNNARNFILNHTYRSYADFLHNIRLSPGRFPSSEELRHKAELRLHALHQECSRYGVEFRFMIPPAVSTQGQAEVLEAGRHTGTKVLLPIPGGALQSEMFRDGFHLNPQGAAIFTDALAKEVKATR